MHGCLYIGRVHHRRFRPVAHEFRYGIGMTYLDLDELPNLLRSRLPLYGARFSPGSFCRDDHLGDPATPLAEAVRDLVEAETGWRERFHANLDEIRRSRLPEELLRTWEFYFCYCEGGFRERVIGDVQILLTRPECRRASILPPLSR